MAQTERKAELETILRDPEWAYDSPNDVLHDEALDDNQKLRVLQSWEFDARELSVAEQENMGGGEDNKLILETIVTVPMVLPPTVIGFYMIAMFSPRLAMGSFLKNVFDVEFVFSFAGIVLGSCVHSLPYMVQPLKNPDL